MNFLLDPLNYEFMRNAIAIGILIGLLCPVVGTYLIVQRLTLLGDVIAHCVLPGMSIALFFGFDLLFGAFTSGLLGSLAIAAIRSQSRVKVDSAMALTFSSFFALGITLITVLENKLDLDSFLFGDILGVTQNDIARTFWITLSILLAIKLFYKELLFYTFDHIGARAIGLPVNAIHIGFIAAITLTIIASMQAVGVILVIALIVGPALTAYLFVQELHQMMLLGALLGVFDSITGIYLSFYYNLPSGPAIILVSSSLFVFVLLLNGFPGIFSRLHSSERYRSVLRFLQTFFKNNSGRSD
jgi:manganese/iron transport system permease protein